MGMFDFLNGEGGGTGGIEPGTGNIEGVGAPGAAGPGISGLLSNPNFLQMLASVGSNVSQGKSAGESLGGPAMQFSRNRALQKTVAKRSQQQATLMQGVIDALRGGGGDGISDVVGPKGDINSADSVTVSDDGISVKLPKRPEGGDGQSKRLTDDPLESFAGSPKAPAGGGRESLPFF